MEVKLGACFFSFYYPSMASAWENLDRGRKYTRPWSRFSHTDRPTLVNKMFIIWQKQE